MLIWQGALAFERWTGQPAPVDLMRAAALRQMNGTRMNTDEHGSGQSESAFIRVHPRSISVRRATPEDAADIARLNADVQRIHAAAHPDFFKPPSATTFPPAHFVELMERPDTVMFVAESEGRIVGYLYGDVTPAMETSSTYAFPRFYIHHISVEPAHQGQGCGTALIEAAKAVARERGIPTLALSVWDFNHKAHAFFARQGSSITTSACGLKVTWGRGARGEGRHQPNPKRKRGANGDRLPRLYWQAWQPGRRRVFVAGRELLCARLHEDHKTCGRHGNQDCLAIARLDRHGCSDLASISRIEAAQRRTGFMQFVVERHPG